MALIAEFEFGTTLPDDVVWDEHESEVIKDGGENVAHAIFGLLCSAGMKPSAPFIDWTHGWFIDAHVAERRYVLQVVGLEEGTFLMAVEKGFSGGEADFKAFLPVIHDLIVADERFSAMSGVPDESTLRR